MRELIAPLQRRQKELLERREFLQAELQKVLDESQHIDALVTQYTSEQPTSEQLTSEQPTSDNVESTPSTRPRKREKISLTDILLLYLEEKQGQVVGYKDIAAAIRSVYAPEALSDGRIASAIRTLMRHKKLYKDETTRGVYQVPVFEED